MTNPMGWSASAAGLALAVAAVLRGRANVLTKPSSLRRARARAVRLITLVAGH
ncbi:MAG: hypothetical protein ABW032_01790 [Burkholderiaceae bacterium]